MLGAGRLEPEARRMSVVDSWSTQISGRKTRKNQRTGVESSERRPLGMAERDPLRDELADHDLEVGDDQERDDHREERRHHRVETMREHLLAERTDRQAR